MRASLPLQAKHFRGFAAPQPRRDSFALDRVTPGPCLGWSAHDPARDREAEEGEKAHRIGDHGHEHAARHRRVLVEAFERDRDQHAGQSRRDDIDDHRQRDHAAEHGGEDHARGQPDKYGDGQPVEHRHADLAHQYAPRVAAGELVGRDRADGHRHRLRTRIAADAGLELARLSGTGPHGRIIRADVEEALASGASGAAVQPAAMLRTASAAVRAEERFVPHNAMRRVIADRLQQSKQTAPHFYLSMDCNIDNLLAARKALNEAAEVSVKISVNDMVVKATAAALMAEPDVNGYFEAEGCRYYSTADICVAVAVDGGLVTPVIHDVQNLGLADISRKTTDLASRARAGTLDPSEYAGGSFTVSNLGMFGIREFAAVINPPQSAILAVGAGEQRPVVKNGELAVATVMTVTLSADHRIVDGALGAKWLQAFKRAIEQPVTMLL